LVPVSQAVNGVLAVRVDDDGLRIRHLLQGTKDGSKLCSLVRLNFSLEPLRDVSVGRVSCRLCRAFSIRKIENMPLVPIPEVDADPGASPVFSVRDAATVSVDGHVVLLFGK